jgi:hypothetical protein
MMSTHHAISRRRMIAMSAAASGLAMSGARIEAQAAKQIEQFEPALEKRLF